jgi:hypothetical protein
MKNLYSDTVKHLFAQSLEHATKEHLHDGTHIHFSKLADNNTKEQFINHTMDSFSLELSRLQDIIHADQDLTTKHGQVISGVEQSFSLAVHEQTDHHQICSSVFRTVDKLL